MTDSSSIRKRNYTLYTEDELDTVMRDDISIREIYDILGGRHTISSIRAKRFEVNRENGVEKRRYVVIDKNDPYSVMLKKEHYAHIRKNYLIKGGAFKYHNRFTSKDDDMILEHSIPDIELSKIIRHSISSIYRRRYLLKHYINK